MTAKLLYSDTEIAEEDIRLDGFDLMDVLYAKGEDFYDSIPDIEYMEPVIAIAEISDGCGNMVPACWELSGQTLSSCFEPIDSFHSFYVDENSDLHSSGTDLRNGTSSYLFRVFKPDICRDEQLRLIDLINEAFEIGADIRDEIDRCTRPVGNDLVCAGI